MLSMRYVHVCTCTLPEVSVECTVFHIVHCTCIVSAVVTVI